MAKSSTWANDLLLLLFNNTAAANIGDAGGLQPSASAGNLYVSLHTADPGVNPSQTTSEASYTGYGRVPVARSNVGWTIAGASVSNAGVVTFPVCTAGTNTISHFGIGTDSAGAGILLLSGALVAQWFPCTGEPSQNRIHAPQSTFVANDPLVFADIEGGTHCSGITLGTVYYVNNTFAPDEYNISATLGGGTLALTTHGTQMVGKISTLAVALNISPAFAIGALVWNEY